MKVDFEEYQRAAMRTNNRNYTFYEALGNGGMGVVGEAAEISEHIKKVLYQGWALDTEKVVREIGDTLWYLALLCDTLGVDLGNVAKMNLEKLKRRYPGQFTVKDSVMRVGE